MSYDLGYELGYESDGEKIPVKASLAAESFDSTVYSMGPPSGVRPGSPEWIRYYTDMASHGGPPPGGTGTGTVGGTPNPNPVPPPPPPVGTGDPSASAGLGAIGGNPVSPGSLPTAAPEGTPDVPLATLRESHSSAEWSTATQEVADYYGISPTEAGAMARHYGSVSEFRTAAGLPNPPAPGTPARVNFNDLPVGAQRNERSAAATALRSRVADDMVHREGERIYGMFAPGEISRETADAMAAQMYRRCGIDPDQNPPDANMLSRMEMVSTRSTASEPSPMDREMTLLRGSSSRVASDPTSGLHRTDTQVTPLMNSTVDYYRGRATERVAPLFGSVAPPPNPPGYYNNTADGRRHRTADASLYLMSRNIDRDPGALRGIARSDPAGLQGSVSTFAAGLGTTGPGRTPTETRRGLETRLASDPSREPDTSNWTAADRSGYRRSLAEMRARYGLDSERDAASHARQVELARLNDGLATARERLGRLEQLQNSLVQAAAQHELTMEQTRFQQAGQFCQAMSQMGFSIGQEQQRHINQMTLQKLQEMAQNIQNILAKGTPDAFSIVQAMLSGPRR